MSPVMPVGRSRKRTNGALFSACTMISAVGPKRLASEQTCFDSFTVLSVVHCALAAGSSATAWSNRASANSPSNIMCGKGCGAAIFVAARGRDLHEPLHIQYL